MLAKVIVTLAYVAIVVTLGLIGMKKTKSFTDFFLSGRSVGPWLTAFTYGTAYFSAVLFIGFAGKIGWGFGISGLWIAIGNALIGTLLVWALLGNRVRKITKDMDAHTMPEFLERRYDSSLLKYFSAVAIFIFFVPYTTAVFMGLTYLFETNFGLPYWTILMFMGLLTGVYLVLGGYKSMIMVDLLFGIIMLFGALVLLFCTIEKADGLSSIVTNLRAINPEIASLFRTPNFWALFSLVFLTSVAPLGMPQLVQKFYAIKDERSVRIGMLISTIFATVITGTAYFTGALTRIFVNPTDNPNAFQKIGENFTPIYDALMPELLTKTIPPYLSMLILLLILSASMSTLAALVLISSSTVTKDVFASIKRNASDKELTTMMRVCSCFFVLLSVLFALLKPAVIVTILAISWGAIGSVFLGPFVWGIMTPRAERAGAIASMFLGLSVCLTLFFHWGPAKAPQAGTVGMIVSLITPLILLPFNTKAGQ